MSTIGGGGPPPADVGGTGGLPGVTGTDSTTTTGGVAAPPGMGTGGPNPVRLADGDAVRVDIEAADGADSPPIEDGENPMEDLLEEGKHNEKIPLNKFIMEILDEMKKVLDELAQTFTRIAQRFSSIR